MGMERLERGDGRVGDGGREKDRGGERESGSGRSLRGREWRLSGRRVSGCRDDERETSVGRMCLATN